MKFEDLLSQYERNLSYAKRMMKEDNISFYHQKIEFWEGYIFACNKWFEECKCECEDFQPKIEKPTDKQIKEIGNYVDEKGGEEYPLIGVLCYRNLQIPVYDDDAGQQMFAVYDHHIIPGGTYNMCPEFDMCYQVDQYLDKIRF